LSFLPLVRRPPPRSRLFPYTTLFRSIGGMPGRGVAHAQLAALCSVCGIDGDLVGLMVCLLVGHLLLAVRRIVRTRAGGNALLAPDRKSTRLNSSHVKISYAVFCSKKK